MNRNQKPSFETPHPFPFHEPGRDAFHRVRNSRRENSDAVERVPTQGFMVQVHAQSGKWLPIEALRSRRGDEAETIPFHKIRLVTSAATRFIISMRAQSGWTRHRTLPLDRSELCSHDAPHRLHRFSGNSNKFNSYEAHQFTVVSPSLPHFLRDELCRIGRGASDRGRRCDSFHPN